MKPLLTTLAMAALVLGATAPVQAALSVDINYDFRGNTLLPTSHSSLAFNASNIVPSVLNANQVPIITATPQVLPNSVVNVIHTTAVTQSVFGLGVKYTGAISTPFGNIPVNDTLPGEIDGLGPNETLLLTFSDFGLVEDVRMTVASVSLVGFHDTVRVTLNGQFVADFNPGFSIGPTDIDLSALGLALVEGDVIGFTIPGKHDNYAVAGVSLRAQVIPEPATAVLWVALGSTFAAGGWWRRRKRS